MSLASGGQPPNPMRERSCKDKETHFVACKINTKQMRRERKRESGSGSGSAVELTEHAHTCRDRRVC